jgi:hypothetical protein
MLFAIQHTLYLHPSHIYQGFEANRASGNVLSVIAYEEGHTGELFLHDYTLPHTSTHIVGPHAIFGEEGPKPDVRQSEGCTAMSLPCSFGEAYDKNGITGPGIVMRSLLCGDAWQRICHAYRGLCRAFGSHGSLSRSVGHEYTDNVQTLCTLCPSKSKMMQNRQKKKGGYRAPKFEF